MKETLFHNLEQLFIAVDQVLNVIVTMCCGNKAWADETLSAHAWRMSLRGHNLCRCIVDTLFFWQPEHCKTSFESELLQRQMPPSERKEP